MRPWLLLVLAACVPPQPGARDGQNNALLCATCAEVHVVKSVEELEVSRFENQHLPTLDGSPDQTGLAADCTHAAIDDPRVATVRSIDDALISGGVVVVVEMHAPGSTKLHVRTCHHTNRVSPTGPEPGGVRRFEDQWTIRVAAITDDATAARAAMLAASGGGHELWDYELHHVARERGRWIVEIRRREQVFTVLVAEDGGTEVRRSQPL